MAEAEAEAVRKDEDNEKSEGNKTSEYHTCVAIGGMEMSSCHRENGSPESVCD